MEYGIKGRLYYPTATVRDNRLGLLQTRAAGLARRGGQIDRLEALDDSSHKYSPADFAIAIELHFETNDDRDGVWSWFQDRWATDLQLQVGSFLVAEDTEDDGSINYVVRTLNK